MGKGFSTRKVKKDKKYSQANLDFLLSVLHKFEDSKRNPYILEQLLGANLDKLDDEHLAYDLKCWARDRLSKASPLKARLMAESLNSFSNLIANFPLGNRANNIELAIVGFKVISTVFTREAFPEEWAKVQNNLGVAYSDRIRGNRANNLEATIAAYEAALEICNRENFPEQWAQTQANLGSAYLFRIPGNRADNLERAITFYKNALQVYSANKFPQEWADGQTNLGSTYVYRIRGNRADNIEKAITYCQYALQVHTREVFPRDWADAQVNLGLAYSERIRGDREQNLEAALRAYEAALQVHTYKAFPERWARLHTNIGLVYLKWTKGDRAENIESATLTFQSALKVYTRAKFPELWAATHKCLGLAYSARIRGKSAQDIEAAIASFNSALTIYTREAFPEDWADVHNSLSIAYKAKGMIAEAIAVCESALQVYSQETFPEKWAGTQFNLSNAYIDRGLINQALTCLRLALEIYKPDAFPLKCLISGRQLGNFAFKNGLWEQAIYGYSVAIEAVETSRSWATSESRRQQILAEAIDVYEEMVQACINTGQLEKALEYVERSRSKRLVDLMASNDLYQDGEISPEVKELLQQFDDLQQRIDQQRSQNNPGNNRERMDVGANLVFAHPNTFAHHRDRASFQAYNEAIASLEAEKLQIWEQLRRLDPVLAGEIKVDAPNFAAIQQLIDQPTTAILSFYTTSNDTHIFVLRQNQIALHTCTDQDSNTLQSWIINNWLNPYVEDNSNWKSKISSFLTELAQRLKLTDLINHHLTGIDELILVPHLFLHQIPIAALPIAEGQYLGDKFLIRYTPSCQVLEFCQNRPHLGDSLTYGTVEDATEDLPCASFEGEQIARLHNIPDHQRLKGKSQATVKNYRELANKVQVIHSSHHAEYSLNHPLNSVLKLADGNITLGQLMTPGWRLPHLSDVFLSCCETGLGLPEITDDILTLSTGFLCAGARSVVSTLWSVDDLATALFSLYYYQHRQQGENRPEALRQAQFNLRFLSGEELATQYKPELTVLLQKKLQQVESQLKAAYTAMKQLKKQPQSQLEGSLSECEQAYSQASKAQRKIKDAEIWLESACKEQFPFSHPRYWAAFTCQGLR